MLRGERIKVETETQRQEHVRGGQGGKEGEERDAGPGGVTVKDGMRDHKTNREQERVTERWSRHRTAKQPLRGAGGLAGLQCKAG